MMNIVYLTRNFKPNQLKFNHSSIRNFEFLKFFQRSLSNSQNDEKFQSNDNKFQILKDDKSLSDYESGFLRTEDTNHQHQKNRSDDKYQMNRSDDKYQRNRSDDKYQMNRSDDKYQMNRSDKQRERRNYKNQNDENNKNVSNQTSNEKIKKSTKQPSFGLINAEKDWLESEFLKNDPDNLERMEVVTDKKPRNYYLFEIRDAIYKDKKLGVQRALKLYREMKLDRKKINSDFYKMLIKGCAIVGYVEKAFDLYDEYMNLNPHVINQSIVTSLFNCCANSPDKQLALNYAKEFYDKLRLDGFNFNLIHYNCLIRTFGLLGDLDTSFAFFDTIIQEKFNPQIDTFNNLLVAAGCDRNQGLAIATNLIQAMRFLNIKPDIVTYNLLYRITRDCHFGTEQELNDHLKHFKFPDAITSHFLRNVLFRQRTMLKNNYLKQLDYQTKQIEQRSEESSTSMVVNEQRSNELMCLNFLGTNVGSIRNQSSIVNIDYQLLNQPDNRLKLIGGLDHLINYMLKDGVKPNIKTISLLSSLIPNDEKEEMKLIKYADKLRIKLDTDFFNMIIRRANFRNELDVAKTYLKLMTQRRLLPNIQTYGVLSIACFSTKEIIDFLRDMDQFGVRPNEVIMGTLIKNAINKFNFFMLSHLIQRLDTYGLRPTKKLVEYLALADEMGAATMKKYEENESQDENIKSKLSESYLAFKKQMNDYFKKNPNIVNEDWLEQFKTEEIPRNEEFHKFKIKMTKLLKEKNRYMNERNLQPDDENDQIYEPFESEKKMYRKF